MAAVLVGGLLLLRRQHFQWGNSSAYSRVQNNINRNIRQGRNGELCLLHYAEIAVFSPSGGRDHRIYVLSVVALEIVNSI